MKSFEEIYAFSCAQDGNGTHPHATCTATAEELKIFISAVMSLTPGSRVVEIGTYTGRSTSVYLQLASAHDLCLDIHLIDTLCWNPKHAAHTFWDMVVDHFNDTYFTYHKMTSNYAAALWNNNIPISFLYIDGEHTSPWVDYDFANWVPFLTSGGILAAHDSQLPAVSACLDKYARSAGWELIAEAERMTIWRKP
jgi:predicted O-methyltransferase YrrM